MLGSWCDFFWFCNGDTHHIIFIHLYTNFGFGKLNLLKHFLKLFEQWNNWNHWPKCLTQGNIFCFSCAQCDFSLQVRFPNHIATIVSDNITCPWEAILRMLFWSILPTSSKICIYKKFKIGFVWSKNHPSVLGPY